VLGTGARRHGASLQHGYPAQGWARAGGATRRRRQDWSKRSHHPEWSHELSRRRWPGSPTSPPGAWLQHMQQLERGLVGLGMLVGGVC